MADPVEPVTVAPSTVSAPVVIVPRTALYTTSSGGGGFATPDIYEWGFEGATDTERSGDFITGNSNPFLVGPGGPFWTMNQTA